MKRFWTWPVGVALAVGAVALVPSGIEGAARNADAAGMSVATSTRPAVTPVGARLFIGKPRPPIDVALGAEGPMESGVPARLVLTVRAAPGIEVTELNLEGGPGLTVVQAHRMDDAIGLADAGSREAGQAVRFEVSATPMAGGMQYLAGLVRFQVNGVSQAAPFRVPLQVGGPAGSVAAGSGKPEAAPARDAVGELIVSMPAETTIR